MKITYQVGRKKAGYWELWTYHMSSVNMLSLLVIRNFGNKLYVPIRQFEHIWNKLWPQDLTF